MSHNKQVHRVLIPEAEIKKRVPRQSMAYFILPDDPVMVFPLNLNPNDADDKVKPVSAYEHCRMRLDKSFSLENQ
jgi:isopenicillin N synthase-like dioxygenase